MVLVLLFFPISFPPRQSLNSLKWAKWQVVPWTLLYWCWVWWYPLELHFCLGSACKEGEAVLLLSCTGKRSDGPMCHLDLGRMNMQKIELYQLCVSAPWWGGGTATSWIWITSAQVLIQTFLTIYMKLKIQYNLYFGLHSSLTKNFTNQKNNFRFCSHFLLHPYNLLFLQ